MPVALYPTARPRRLGAAPPAALAGAVGGVGAPPISRLFSFVVAAAADTHSAKSSPRLRGPALITSLSYVKEGGASISKALHLGKSVSSVTLTDVPNTTPLPYTSLFEQLPPAFATLPVIGGGSARVDASLNVGTDPATLGLVILDPEFFLVVGVVCGPTGLDRFHGQVVILEQVSREALATFL